MRSTGESSSISKRSSRTIPISPSITLTSSAALKQLLLLSPDALVVIDQDGMIQFVNAQLCDMFGYASDQLIGQPLETLLPDRLHTKHVAYRTAYVAASHPRPMGVGLDLVGRRQDGTEFAVDISLRPCALKGRFYVIAAVRDVSAQRQLERERVDLLARLHLQTELINLARDAILVRGPTDRILLWNKGAEELYGWTAQEAIGRITHTLFKTRFPFSRTSVQAQLDQLGFWEGELTHTRPDGRLIIVESRQVVVRDAEGHPSATLEINRDITERRHLEEAEATTQANALLQLGFFQQVLDALPNGVYVVYGQDAQLVVANRALGELWGAVWTPDQPMAEFLDQHQFTITDLQGRRLEQESWATIRAVRYGESIMQLQEVIHRPQAGGLPVLVSAVPLSFSFWRSLSGSAAATSGGSHSRDLAAQHAGDESLALVILQDVHLLKEAEYLKEEFIGIAAHELRTPVAQLKGAIGTLLVQTREGHGPALAEWQREMLDDIGLATDRLTSLMDELLDITRLQAGQLTLRLVPTDLAALAGRVVRRAQELTTRHRIALEVVREHSGEANAQDAPRDAVPELVARIDTARIEQVLTNLVMNAIKYSPAGGLIQVTLVSRERSQRPGRAGGAAHLDAEGEQHEEVAMSVRDEGIGIPAHQQGLIFGRFVRADNGRRHGIDGTGLGLYICRELIERHRGEIWFESEEGKGSTFHVLLPLMSDIDSSGM